MPIFEYQCTGCGHQFEKLVMGQEAPVCPDCSSPEVCKLMSTCGFFTKGDGGQTVRSSSSSSSCGGCTASSCSGCGQ
ncbi:MAG: zinc ribbon domain-containing protein [Desulfobacteraceae bacterium]|jgi:putative FmdB family regulatory protein